MEELQNKLFKEIIKFLEKEAPKEWERLLKENREEFEDGGDINDMEEEFWNALRYDGIFPTEEFLQFISEFKGWEK